MAEPSKVIHIRNVGNAITEDELLELVKPFGAVAKLVMLRAKNQVLQMEDMEASASAVEHYTSVQANVRDLYLQFSSHQELTANDQTSQGQRSDQESQPNRILLVSIHNRTYPITIDVLHQVFSPQGFVEKIFTFQKSVDTHEYAGSNLNGFNSNTVKNYKYCCSPTKMIHVPSPPQEITQDAVLTHLAEFGTIVSSKLFQVNGKKQALILFENEAQATETLVCKHGTTVDHPSILPRLRAYSHASFTIGSSVRQ